MKNTYIQDRNFKNYEFSKGEEMTAKDLECVASRTKRTYQTDASYEAYLSEDYSSTIFMKDGMNEYSE